MASNKLSDHEYAYMAASFELRESSQGFFHLACPFCGEKIGRSGSYKPSISRYYCMQPGCTHGKALRPKGTSVVDLVRDLENKPDARAAVKFLYSLNPKTFTNTVQARTGGVEARKPASKVLLPYGYKNILHGDSKVARDARKYLKGRGYNLDVSGHVYQLGYIDTIDPDGKKLYGYLVIPFFNEFGDLIYYQLRAIYDYLQRWDNPPSDMFNLGKETIMFNQGVVFKPGKCFVHEGATDGMTTHSPGTLGLSLSDYHVETFRRGRKSDLFFMYDEGAYMEGLQNAWKATGSGKRIWLIPIHKGESDPNDLGLARCIEKRDKEAIRINDQTFFEESNRVEWEMKGNARKSFRGKPGLSILF